MAPSAERITPARIPHNTYPMIHTTHTRRAARFFCAAFVPFGAAGVLSAASVQGPSSSATPYVSLSSVFSGQSTLTSILTVGDSAGTKPNGSPYRMVGVPDGLGAFDNGNGTFTLLMNHELGANSGIARDHGATGSFVSEWVINKSDFSVVGGKDLIQQVALWNGSGFSAPAQGVAFNRFCSADLPAPSAFYDASTGLGTQARIFMNGEESGDEGRAFAHVVTGSDAGTSYELAALGKFSHENSVANAYSGAKTIVIGTDDSTGGQLYVYAGTKTNTGNDVEKAGLTNGSLYGIKLPGVPTENRMTGVDGVAGNRDGASFVAQNLGNASNLTGAALGSLSSSAGVTGFLRPEDGAWNPSNPNEFFFVTTDRFSNLKESGTGQDGRSRLWKLTFSDLNDVSSGGTLSMLLEGGTGAFGNAGQMFDNITVDTFGNILIQEDPGNNPYLSKIWQYNLASGSLTQVAGFRPDLFLNGPGFLTTDEESSGILDITSIMGSDPLLNDRWYLFDVQAHYSIPSELAEGGQLLALHIVPVPEPSTYGLLAAGALAGLIGLRRFRAKRRS